MFWRKKPMTPKRLSSKIRKLNEKGSVTADFERALTKRGVWNRNKVWYSTQKEHWLGWLKEYDGPGYYGRKKRHRSAEFAYNHSTACLSTYGILAGRSIRGSETESSQS
jgi:hypothetical protein